ncbi:myelin-associated glycoprotein-like [Cololabis saira]|uniref:myelin-associated glycoprotein-like n=1 Tax=Cololabis saira TaxID=129043 RepID=UPI002AD2F7EB|nr:myelin-associated glycoprotein-like [Cololabis saira]
MFVLIWATLMFSLRERSAYIAGASGREHCTSGYCVTLNEQLRAEAGLCVVIPCSFTTYFTPQYVVWFKCEPGPKKCVESDMIFHSNKANKKPIPGFKGRVSLLGSETGGNCGIMINDLQESDSGSYQVRVNGLLYGSSSGWTFTPKTTISINGLNQKPTLKVPPLTEGQESTLTCTAPGLCSGSRPEITWTWGRAGEKDSNIPGNITGVQTDEVSAVAQRHSSTLKFNLSADHHDTNITCKVRFTGGATTEDTVTLKMNYFRRPHVTGITTVKEGEDLNLTCSVDSFPPSVIRWLKSGVGTLFQNDTDTYMSNKTDSRLLNDSDTYLLEGANGTGSLFISKVGAEDSGLFICIAEYLNNTTREEINVTVIYKRRPRITGSTTVKEEEHLNLTCSADSFPPSLVMWTKRGSNTSLHLGANSDGNYGSAQLLIPNATAEDSGEYACTAKHRNSSETVYADVTVTWFRKIRHDSGCVLRSEALICVCISEGSPVPTVEWPLLQKHTEYSVFTTVSQHTVNSSITVTGKDHRNITVECRSSNEKGEATEKLPILQDTTGGQKNIWGRILRLDVIISFLTGLLLSAVICCLVKTCRRKKTESPGNVDETWEMMTDQDNQENRLIYNNLPENQNGLQEGAMNAAMVVEKAVTESNWESNDVDYANIDFSALKRKSPGEAAKERENTEYAEIKTKVKEERGDDDGEEGEMSEVKEGGEELMDADEDTQGQAPEVEEEADGAEETDGAVYTSVKDLIEEVRSVRRTRERVSTSEDLVLWRKMTGCPYPVRMFAVRLLILVFVVKDVSTISMARGNNNSTFSCKVTQHNVGDPFCSCTLQLENATNIYLTFYCQNVSENCTCQVQTKNLTCDVAATTTPTTLGNVSSTTPNQVSTVGVVTTAGNSSIEHSLSTQLLKTMEKLPPIALFSAGVIVGMTVSAIIACLAVKCQSYKKRSINLSEDLEMVTTQTASKVEDDEIQDEEAAAEGGVESDELLVPYGEVAPKEAEYSAIDFSAMRRKTEEEENEKRETTETEYAEIKREELEQRRNNNGEDGEMLVYSNENEVTTKADEELSQNQNPSPPAEDAYSNLKEIMAQTSDVDVGEVTE